MKSLLTVAASLLLLLLSPAVLAADKDGEITGTVAVEEDEKGKIENITLTAEDGTVYTVAPAGKGAKLAKEAAGETVEVTGKVATKKDKDGNETQTLNVANFVVIFKGTVEIERDGKKIVKITLGGREVKLDGKAKELVEKAEGKEVVATGEVQIRKASKDKEEEKLLVIRDFKVAGEEKDKK